MTRWQWFKQSHVWIPSAFVAFFAVVFLANGIMIFSALNSWRGLASESPWVKDAGYRGVVDPDAARGGLDWDVGIDVTGRDGGRTAEVAVRLTDAAGKAIEANSVRVGFVRPTDDGYDTMARLRPQGGGVYAATVDLPLPGLWEVRVAARRGEDDVHRTKRVTLRP